MTAAAACAQGRSGDFPNRPIRYIVPFVAGAGTDITARTVAQKLGERVGQQVVVDNRPGAAGNIGMELTAKAPADGYTIVLVSASHTVNRSLQKLNYDLLRDFAPLSQITAQPYCLTVHPSVPVHTVKELLALARAKPNTLTYGSSGAGGLSHLAGAMLASLGKIEWIHVPYKGGAAAINDMLGGQINSQFTTIIGTIQHVKAGRLRWLAISTAKRSTAVPDLPTVAEAGVPGFAVEGWDGILAPAATPKRIVETLGREIGASLRSPDVNERFSVDGSVPVGSTPEEFSAHIRSEVTKWAKVTRDIGMRAE
ncbi:MAG TPA: tripartite tricarboxylate transporter substrate binding protein [Burkholderiales bacterium]|nr:tripartite tricarboxylate transporter substrate binding protein [Burkholderiales bacterium]